MRGGFRIGAGRPMGRNTVNITLTLTKNEADTLKERAKSMNMTVSRFVSESMHLNTLPDNLTGGMRLSNGIV